MSVKKSYNRYFIIFQEEDRGYGMAIDKQPTGYTKIENRSGRCKITVYAQNLLRDKGPYTCCLVDATKDPLVFAKLGQINIDDTGRGETWWEFKEDDIADTGVPFDRFNVAAVITEGNNVYAPLAGYIGKDRVSWKDRIPSIPRAIAEEPVEEEPAEEDEEARKFNEYEESLKENKEDNKKASNEEKKDNVKSEAAKKDENKGAAKAEGEKKGDNKGEKKEENKGENKGEKKEENKGDNKGEKKEENKGENKGEKKEENKGENKGEKKEENKGENKGDGNPLAGKKDGNDPDAKNPFKYEDTPADEVSGYMNNDINLNRDGDRERRPLASMFHDILEDFDEVEGVSEEFEGTRWWKIPLEDEIPISENIYYPYFCAVYHLKMAYPYINYIKYFKDTGHYYFGMKYDNDGEVKYILYGIEGKNASSAQPYMGMTGFIRWIKMKDKDKGMWIMYYNPHTGNIMIPKKR